MTRPRDLGAGLFHITCHSVWDGVLFREDLDRVNYLSRLAASIERAAWKCLAAVLMTTHVHLILDVEAETLAEGMQELNFAYASEFNSRHRRRGHVFGARYGARRIESNEYLLTCYRYVVLNPVEAGLAAKPEDWRWSSYAAAIGLSDDFAFVDPARVLDCFGDSREVAVARLRAFVEEP